MKKPPWNKLDWSLIASYSQLYYLYWTKGMNLEKLAEHLGVSECALTRHLKEINFSRRGAKKEPTKTEKIIKLLEENPFMKTKKLADLSGSSYPWVRKVKSNFFNERKEVV